MPVYTYNTLDDPSSIGANTFANDINSTGQIVGDYRNNSGTHGFLYSGGNYAPLDDPSATTLTVAYGINDAGQVVGQLFTNSGTHGFLLSGGTYTPSTIRLLPGQRLHRASTTR